MKVLHVCFADKGGGAAIGAYRSHTAMLSQGVKSNLLVARKRTTDPTVIRLPFSMRLRIFIWRKLSAIILKFQLYNDYAFRSLNIFPTGIHNIINDSDADIVQFHWISFNTVAIQEFKKIRKPIVWKLPDMWAFCGSEHYTFNEARYAEGYKASNKSDNHYGLDLDKIVWLQKKKHWGKVNMTIVCPSKWLAKCAKSSYLLKKYPIHNIANPINMDIYKPASDIKIAREHFNLPIDKKVILFSSLHKLKDPRKGFGYLDGSIHELTKKIEPSTLCIAIMGIKTKLKSIHGVAIVNLGYLEEDNEMALAYSSANVCFFPSNADSTPNTIKESMSCGTPCVAFDIEGVQEMITHKQNGYLVPVGDVTGLSEGLEWTLSQDESLLSSAVRDSAFKLHDHKSRVKDYLELYSRILSSQYS